MKMRVENTLQVYKNVFNDASGNANRYQYPLPWIPGRSNGDAGLFVTSICSDCIEILSNYLGFARISKEEVSSDFYALVDDFGYALTASYISSFLYLAGAYYSALFSKEWMDCQKGELIEYTEFLCSVANDASESLSNSIFSSGDESAELLVHTENSNTSRSNFIPILHVRMKNAFKLVEIAAVEQLSCVILSIVFSGRPQLLQTRDACNEWLSSVRGEKVVSETDSDRPSVQLIPQLMSKLTTFLLDRVEYLKFTIFVELLRILTDKLILYIFALLEGVHSFGLKIIRNREESELSQIHFDIMSVKKCLMTVAMRLNSQELDLEALQKMLLERFQLLDFAYTLLSEPAMSHPFVEALQGAQSIAEREQQKAPAIARMIEVCMDLRQINLLQSKSVVNNAVKDDMNPNYADSSSVNKQPPPSRFRVINMLRRGRTDNPVADDLSEMIRMKEEMLVQWVNNALTHIRGMTIPPLRQPTEHLNVSSQLILPEVEVFAPGRRRYSLRAYLLQSHLPPAARELDTSASWTADAVHSQFSMI